jgi:5-methylcytosine-specific restriction endonuclease McrA
MSNVFVIDTNKQPLNPVHPGRARILLSTGQAAIFRCYPFTIILKQAVKSPIKSTLRLKIDPGSKTTGMAIVNDDSGDVVFAAELSHRGQVIKKALDDRRAHRRSRRERKTRYRKARFQNRKRTGGWLPPSLESRVDNVLTWVCRLCRYCPIAALSQELVRFDLQALQNPEIKGIEYQQGTLQGYETREYLLVKWDHHCAYCGQGNVPLQVEHVLPRSRGGTDSVSNLVLACEACNIAKGTRRIEDFLEDNPEVLRNILNLTKAPLKDASAMNVTRWTLYEQLRAMGLPVEVGTGGHTKYNRVLRALPKAHWLDAACVGALTPAKLKVERVRPLLIKAKGHGRRQTCITDEHGFPRRHKSRQKRFLDFQTGDIVKAVIPKGKYAGTHFGRVVIASGQLSS